MSLSAYVAYIVCWQDLDAFLGNDVAGVDFVFEEEGCDSGLGVAVDHRPS